MANMYVVIDANVLLELVIERTNAEKVKKFLVDQKKAGNEVVLSALSAHLVYHFGSQYFQTSDIKKLLDGFEIIELSGDDFTNAFEVSLNDDFEDAVQLACAIRHGASEFVTFDKKLARDYKDFAVLKVRLLA